jgi:hypothetical protein
MTVPTITASIDVPAELESMWTALRGRTAQVDIVDGRLTLTVALRPLATGGPVTPIDMVRATTPTETDLQRLRSTLDERAQQLATRLRSTPAEQIIAASEDLGLELLDWQRAAIRALYATPAEGAGDDSPVGGEDPTHDTTSDTMTNDSVVLTDAELEPAPNPPDPEPQPERSMPVWRSLEDRVLDVMRADRDRTWTAPQLAEHLPTSNPTSISRALAALRTNDVVHRVKHGVYQLCDIAEPEAATPSGPPDESTIDARRRRAAEGLFGQ